MLNFLAAVSGNGAGGGGSFESIATYTVTSGTVNSFEFTSIPATYQHLQIRATYKDSDTATLATKFLDMYLNNDFGNNYAFHSLTGNGSAASASGSATQGWIRVQNAGINSGSGGTNMVGVMVIDIHDYSSTNKNKTLRVFSGGDVNGTAGALSLSSGLWQNTAAINRLTFESGGTGAFAVGSTFALYGIKGL